MVDDSELELKRFINTHRIFIDSGNNSYLTHGRNSNKE
jgi:hypothetical protein